MCLGLAFTLVYLAGAAPAGLRAPTGVLYLAAGTCAAAAGTLLLQVLGRGRGQAVAAFLMGAGMTGLTGWVAFGAGPRHCQAAIGGFGFVPSELVCRTAFGVGTLLLGVVAWLMLRPLLRREPRSRNGAA